MAKTFGGIEMAKNPIEMTASDVRSINSTPYHAGPKARKFEKAEIDKVLCMKVVEPVQAEWASLIVFVSKIDGSLRFCIK